MGDNGWLWRCEQVIGSELSAGRRVLDELLHEMQARSWTYRDRFGVHLAMEEALVNALRHGNQLDPRKQVRVCCRLGNDVVQIEISDQGPGFDPDGVPDPTHPDRRLLPGGRGLLLMRAFMSQVEFGDSGRQVTLTKKRIKDK